MGTLRVGAVSLYKGRVSLLDTTPARSPGSAALLLASLALVGAVAAIGGRASARSIDGWYDGLDRAPWNPPGWVFGPAWTVLYVLMAVAAWLVAREGLGHRSVQVALAVYLVQLALNLGWSLLFFGAREPGWALVEIVALLAAIVVTIVAFHGISTAAAWLLVPYALWVTFAATLNAWIAVAN
jgi:benzodiazapine receptor